MVYSIICDGMGKGKESANVISRGYDAFSVHVL